MKIERAAIDKERADNIKKAKLIGLDIYMCEIEPAKDGTVVFPSVLQLGATKRFEYMLEQLCEMSDDEIKMFMGEIEKLAHQFQSGVMKLIEGEFERVTVKLMEKQDYDKQIIDRLKQEIDKRTKMREKKYGSRKAS